MQSAHTTVNHSLALRIMERGRELAASPGDRRTMIDKLWNYDSSLDAVAASFALRPSNFRSHSVIHLAGQLKAQADGFAAQKDHVRARLIQGAKGYGAATYEWEEGDIHWAALVAQFSECFKVVVAFSDGVRDHAGGAFSIEIGYRISDKASYPLHAFMIPDVLIRPRDPAHDAAIEREKGEAHAALGPDGFSRIVNAVLYAVGAHLVMRHVEQPAAGA